MDKAQPPRMGPPMPLDLPPPQRPQISMQQVREAAAAFLTLVERDTTLIPGSLRRNISLLEVLMRQVVSGETVLAGATPPRVESGLDNDRSAEPDKELSSAEDNTAKQTPEAQEGL